MLIALNIASFTYGGLLGGFLLGVLSRKADQTDAIIAMATAILVMTVLWASQQFGLTPRLVDGLWFTTVTVQPANVERAIASTLDELERAVRDGITEKEVEHYKSNFAGSFKVGLATNAGIAARLVDAEFFGFGPGYLDEFPEHVAKVTTDEVNEALRRHVRLDALTTVVAGDLDEREPAEAG